jgi:hypothetical protein
MADTTTATGRCAASAATRVATRRDTLHIGERGAAELMTSLDIAISP